MNTCNNCKHAKTSLMAEPCYSCYCMSHWKRPTNADRIRSMTDEELAEWIERIRMLCANDGCGRACPLYEICYSMAIEPVETLDWLKQEAKE